MSNIQRQSYKDSVKDALRVGKGEINDYYRAQLDLLARQVGLSSSEKLGLEDEVQIPFRQYENALFDALKRDYPRLKKESIALLSSLQSELNLEDEDVKIAVLRLQQRIMKGEIKENSSSGFKFFTGGMGLSFSTWVIALLLPAAAPVVGPVVGAVALMSMIGGFATQFGNNWNVNVASNSLNEMKQNKEDKS